MVCTRSNKGYNNYSSEISTDNIVGGTRQRKQFNYRVMNQYGGDHRNALEVMNNQYFSSRPSHNTLEMRNKTFRK